MGTRTESSPKMTLKTRTKSAAKTAVVSPQTAKATPKSRTVVKAAVSSRSVEPEVRMTKVPLSRRKLRSRDDQPEGENGHRDRFEIAKRHAVPP